MRKKAALLGVAAFAAASAFGAAAADPTVEVRALAAGTAPAAARIEDLAWIEGRWEGEGFGGVAEEVILPAAAGQMPGIFRLRKPDGSLNFYEFYAFVQTGESLTLRIKHFTPDFVGWEEKEKTVDMKLAATESCAVYFDGVTFKRFGRDRLVAAVNVGGQGVVPLSFRRVKGSGAPKGRCPA